MADVASTEDTKSAASSQVVVLSGVPGYADEVDGVGAYPSSTTDVMKVLREAGLSVEYRDPPNERKQVSLFGIDIWIPVLQFTQDALASGAGDLLAASIRTLFGRQSVSDGTLHVKFGREDGDGQVEWFEATGPGDEVLDAARQFLKRR